MYSAKRVKANKDLLSIEAFSELGVSIARLFARFIAGHPVTSHFGLAIILSFMLNRQLFPNKNLFHCFKSNDIVLKFSDESRA